MQVLKITKSVLKQPQGPCNTESLIHRLFLVFFADSVNAPPFYRQKCPLTVL